MPAWPPASSAEADVAGVTGVTAEVSGSGGVSVAAVDLGASSGRVMLARIGPGQLSLDEVHRFPNVPVRAGGTLHWDILALYREVLAGIQAAARAAAQTAGETLASVGIDSWGVDYGL